MKFFGSLIGLFFFINNSFAEDGAAKKANYFYNLGAKYYIEKSDPEYEKRAMDYFKLAAELGHAQGIIQYSLSLISRAKTQNQYIEARDWLLKAAKLGDNLAQYYLGKINQEGLGISKNIPKAAMWFYASSENGNNLSLVTYSTLEGDLSKDEKIKIMDQAKYWISP